MGGVPLLEMRIIMVATSLIELLLYLVRPEPLLTSKQYFATLVPLIVH